VVTIAFRRTAGLLLFAVTLLAVSPSFAVQPDEILPDPALEHRARELSRVVRCMVCQNQSIDDSEATLARDLRLLVRERLKAGDSDQQVLDFLVARYGPFVLLKPRFGLDTALLWLAPAGVLLIGLCGLVVFLRRRNDRPGDDVPQLTEAERTKLAGLLGEGGPSTGKNS
jgi:cytochrome c-type biogenesis protein CcmH